jgi:hypothetical protein
LIYPGGGQVGEAVYAYVQVFREGAFEFAMTGGTEHGGQRFIPSTHVTTFYRDALIKGIDAARDHGLSGPAIFRAALLDATGFEFGVGGMFWRRNSAFADRADLALPDAWIDSITDLRDFDAVMRPQMDILWQAFDIERCLEYTPDGLWKPRS